MFKEFPAFSCRDKMEQLPARARDAFLLHYLDGGW